ncbi:S8 family peptidase [uncultured Gilliamella sp.]|uniref:S8 family peptidase n=1 Tax=unclassified Gilliamella TaxID=2685620 RepID=UPI001E08A9FD|nr:S8 family peptidase [Gilliamella sp. B14448G7]MBI0034425.1 S8 family peptidase [Gilliamella sp. B14448G11]MBI0041645.1 S8 family peptidase [Gilliamella sp. B14448G12]
MNNVLELHGNQFGQSPKLKSFQGISMNGHIQVTYSHICRLKNKIEQIRDFWVHETTPFDGILISVHYNKIVAKSNRIAGLFQGKKSNFAIVGAKFNKNKTKHIITYFLTIQDLEKSIKLLSKTGEVLNEELQGVINKAIFEHKKTIDSITYEKYKISKSLFKQVIADISYIDDFDIEEASEQITQSLVTLYDTKTDTKELLNKLGISILSSRILDNHTVFLDENQLDILLKKAPYLVSMATADLSQLSPEEFIQLHQKNITRLPEPTIEPTIGVIDTLFASSVYFQNWVEYYDMVDPNIHRNNEDYKHGTAVSSIIVDGPALNPWLDDGCGRFKVRHFGVATKSQFSSFTIIKQIKEIVAKNKDIKVWNLSLGSNQEINDNFISAEAAILDQIQYENDVIFVIAGTNKPNNNINKIGSPADSINSIVVNSVTRERISASYTRKGIALSFFAKPDVSYYGGSREQFIHVCEPLGGAEVAGTSYAAPWIARKLAYLINILQLKREIAKALIIDAAKGWNRNPTPHEISLYGHGIVPIKIDDIIKTNEDEIKFLISDVSEKWNTYNYRFPVPIVNDKYPYIARATMCYFPKCNRTQGVDYTNTELNLHFGRMNDKGKIYEINGDTQNRDTDDKSYLFESEARNNFRKWDNVKYIAEVPKENNKPKISYKNNKNWGMEIKTNNRLDPKDGEYIRFGVVVTLKEINGINRIEEFIRNCELNGWFVNKLNIDVKMDIHQILNEDIEFE